MCTSKHHFKFIMGFFISLMFFSNSLFSQEFNLSNQASELIVYGTSNLHDWDVKAEQQKGQLVLDLSDNLQIQKMKIEIVAESLKSGKNGMDKNTYKALNTNTYKNITFQWNETKDIKKMDNGNYNVKTTGDLTIAGATKRINLDFTINVSSNKVTIKGEKTIKMTDYKVDPPTALFGTITTGDEITIKFNTILTN